jgi:hypothetical protein
MTEEITIEEVKLLLIDAAKLEELHVQNEQAKARENATHLVNERLHADNAALRNSIGGREDLQPDYLLQLVKDRDARIEQLRAENERLREGMEWRDIASAPFDIELLLLLENNDTVIGTKKKASSLEVYYFHLEARPGDVYTWVWNNPIAWQHLPPAPTNTKPEE